MTCFKHSLETRNPEPLRKLAYPIEVFEGLTIDGTLCFVNRRGMWFFWMIGY